MKIVSHTPSASTSSYYAYSVIGVKQSTIEGDPETCAAFVRAMLKALKTVQEDRATAEKVLQIEFPTLTEEGKRAALDRAYEDNLWSVDGIISQQAVDTCMEVVTVSGLFEGEWDYEKMVDLQFVEAASSPAAE